MNTRTTATLLLLAAAPTLGHAAPSTTSAPDPPTNVVVVLMDEVGTDFLEMYDAVNPYRRDLPYDATTIGSGDDPAAANLFVHAPNLEALAADGVQFMNAYAQPMCSPTRAALLTGNYATRTGVGDIFKWPAPDYAGAVTDFGDPGFDQTTLPELLAPSSFTSAVFGKWHLAMPTADMDPATGTDCYMGWASIPERGGFDEWGCVFNGLDNEPAPTGAGYYDFYFNRNFTDHADVLTHGHVVGEYATVVQFDEALEWCTSVDGPFFCLITPNASHSPFQDLPPLDLVTTTEYEAATSFNAFTRFCASLEAMDTKIGDLVAGLDAEGLMDDTLFIVMGDNGTPEIVMEHARRRFSAAVHNAPELLILGSDKDLGETYDHILGTEGGGDGRFKGTVYEKGTRVPLIVAGAGVLSPGRVSEALVQVEDLFPTIAALLGVTAGDVNGVSFAGILDDTVPDALHARDHVWSQRFRRTGHAAVSPEQELHQIGCSLQIPGEGRFKIVRDALSGADEFYQLEDATGADVDRFETEMLDCTSPTYSALYDLVAAKIDDVMSEASSGSSCVDPPAAVDCVPVANSTDAPAILGSSGTTHIECNDLVLTVTGAVPNKSARFFYGQTSVASAPAGDGNLCICTSGGCPTFRLDVFETDDEGNASFAVDLSNLPSGGDVAAGETWYFQLWYRDPFGDLGTGFNFSNSLEVTFCD